MHSRSSLCLHSLMQSLSGLGRVGQSTINWICSKRSPWLNDCLKWISVRLTTHDLGSYPRWGTFLFHFPLCIFWIKATALIKSCFRKLKHKLKAHFRVFPLLYFFYLHIKASVSPVSRVSVVHRPWKTSDRLSLGLLMCSLVLSPCV